MIWLFISSSNVYRTYKHNDFSEYQDYKLVKCTSSESFTVALDNIWMGKGEVIVKVIENFLCKAKHDNNDSEEKNKVLEKNIKEYLKEVRVAENKQTGE